MDILLAVFVVVVFALVLERLSLPRRAREVLARSSDALAVLRDGDLTDAEKEKRLQRQSRRLFGLLGVLAGGSLLALGLPLAVVWVLGQMGLGSLRAVLDVLERLDFLVAVTAGGVVAFLLLPRLGSP